MSARNKYGSNDPFGKVCESALSEAQKINELYDAILVDEAQDFSPSFLRMCYEMLKAPKRLVYAYDELQNLRLQSLPSPDIIFGLLSNGKPKVEFVYDENGNSNQDIILEKCYRNSRPALVTAHALGFGIYKTPSDPKESGLVQMFEQNTLWKDIGYEVAEGELKDGCSVTLKRTSETSPKFLENHSDIDDLIVFKSFATKQEQDEWVSNQIKINLCKDELRSDDIIVINPNPLTTKMNVAPIRAMLYQNGINSHTAGVDTTPDVFFDEDNIAFTGIYRAKGNEAAMVYVIDAESCYDSNFDRAKIRNQLFTAITRSKAWIRVLGVGENMDKLIEEYNQVKSHNFSLEFIYPTKAQRDKMNIVNRDMSEAEKHRVKQSKANISDLIASIENGQIFIEDLGEDNIARLKALLKNEE